MFQVLFVVLVGSKQVCQPICAVILEVMKNSESVLGNIAFLSSNSEWNRWSMVLYVGIASLGLIIAWYRALPRKDCGQKIYVTIRCDNTVRTLRSSPQQQLREFKHAAAKLHGIPDGDGTIIIRVRGRALRDDEMTLEAAGISNHCVVRLDLELRGGAGPDFSSIPVKNYRPLLAAIRADFQNWLASCTESPRYKWGRLKGQEVKWDGMSDCVKFFFEAANINPSEKYRQFYDDRRHTIATSYVWSVTGLLRMAGKPFVFGWFCID